MKSVFITGAAAGIGKAIAEHFHAEGWFVGLYDINLEGVQTVAAALGERTHCGALDVTDAAAWKVQLESFFDRAGSRLDLLINNAGILFSGPYEDISLTEHKSLVDINVGGVINGCHCALPFLQQTANSCVINMASASAMYGQPSLVSYAASKFAVRGLTEGLNLEWRAHGVRVVDVWPIFVKTKMVDGMRAKSIERFGVKLSPDDVAKVVLQAAQAGPKSRKVHYLVGLDAKVLSRALGLLPDALAARIVGGLAT